MYNPIKRPPAPFLRPTMTLPADQRRVLAMLASPGRNGVTQVLLAAYGFDANTIAGLIGRGLATIAHEKALASINVAHVRITETGRAALAAAG
jgi:hypothetical protein